MFQDSRQSFGPMTLIGTNGQRAKRPAQFCESDANCLEIGLINNMPDTALRATERQFHSLLTAAAEGIVVRLKLFTLPDVPRVDWGQAHVSNFYSDIHELWDSHLDGLIVTGTEPRASNLMDEPYWGSLTQVLEWAEHNTQSTVWSCLAAHAAVLHLDGIIRRPLDDKRFGVFESARMSDHPMMATVPNRVPMPHSRWNELPASALVASGYRVLTQSADAGIDAFVKQRKSLFVFFQGHPEYDTDALLLEYRRDIGRFLRHERQTYPQMPHGYFDRNAVEALMALRDRALADRREELLADFPTDYLAATVANTWRPEAARMYRNWLTYICTKKARKLRSSQIEPVRAAAT